jgi:hypothetical protein
MKREQYEALTPTARESHDNDTLIGFIVRCRVPTDVAIEAINERMKFLSVQSREYVVGWLRRHAALPL